MYENQYFENRRIIVVGYNVRTLNIFRPKKYKSMWPTNHNNFYLFTPADKKDIIRKDFKRHLMGFSIQSFDFTYTEFR
jgi:hypothetical protein